MRPFQTRQPQALGRLNLMGLRQNFTNVKKDAHFYITNSILGAKINETSEILTSEGRDIASIEKVENDSLSTKI